MKTPRFSKTIGIVGGAGPMASSFLYSTILEVCQKQYHSNDYNEFPEIVLVSYPFTRGNKEKTKEEISLCLKKLQAAGDSLFCITSHSFHGFLPTLPEQGFINLVQEGIKEAKLLHMTKILVLAAPATIELKLYEQPSFQCIYPKNQPQITQIIREIAGGKIEESQAQILKTVISQTHKQTPFDGILLACTELPLLHKKWRISDTLPVINTIDVLARELVRLA